MDAVVRQLALLVGVVGLRFDSRSCYACHGFITGGRGLSLFWADQLGEGIAAWPIISGFSGITRVSQEMLAGV